MTQVDIIQMFKDNSVTGDDLLNLPITNKYDAGRVLVEIYYYLLDVNEARILAEEPTPIKPERFRELLDKARNITNKSIAQALDEIWCEE